MRAIYLDCFSGISGNMLLGALLDIGLPEAALRDELAKLPVDGYDLQVNRVTKCGISATYVDVVLAKHQHHHRHLPDIMEIIEKSSLPDAVKEKSKKVFTRLAEAEAKVHGTTLENIHFHEVGAVDAIIDVVGTVFGLHYLGIEAVYASKVHVGSGFIRCSHGLMSVPAPATAELLQGIPYYKGDIRKELATPTGAALVSTFAAGFGEMPAGFQGNKIGYGAGTWDLEIPNVLAMHLGEMEDSSNHNEVFILEANLDDYNPQNYSYVMDKLFAAGAFDVWLTPIIMKKGRPAVTLSVMLPPDKKLLDTAAQIILFETTSLGVRYYTAGRKVTARKFIQVDTAWGKVHVKIGYYNGQICNAAPEYEECRQLAEMHGVSLKQVQQAAALAASQFVADNEG